MLIKVDGSRRRNCTEDDGTWGLGIRRHRKTLERSYTSLGVVRPPGLLLALEKNVDVLDFIEELQCSTSM